MESIEPAPTYELSSERLLETRTAGLYDWPVQMAEKNWVDTEAFVEAFTKALSLHAGKLNGAAILPNSRHPSIRRANKRASKGRLVSIAR